MQAHRSQVAFESIGRNAEVATNKILEADEDLELLHRLARIKILVVVGSNSTYREVESVASLYDSVYVLILSISITDLLSRTYFSIVVTLSGIK